MMHPRVYLAGRSEDAEILRGLRTDLRDLGVDCTSRWLDGFSDDARAGALNDLDDIAAADVFVLYNPPSVHRSGTGGRHFETGYAWMIRRPILLIGAPENIFHALPAVSTVPLETSSVQLARAIFGLRTRAHEEKRRPLLAQERA